ncbi:MULTISPECIES: hypothetical protein [Streptomyces]|uniref:Uncharacterized protein n=1 Tax=Streptomyces dengpaensis TaxID=2049881 RepID=A0ABM6T008_9ACTN|nr:MULTISPECIES: hypothetical protein [Streptomyces]AVH60004.1 hypothetical protein C4B68_34200 [Streptomyces dengpaensis]PIB09642.1 hypothetical protein B1C81_10875 [Streptomyces sp. HG99]
MVDAWATPQQVIDITGVTVTDAELSRAQSSVEVFCNRIYTDTPRMRLRDLYWLARAVAYQAAWEKGQFDLNTRLDANQVQQDGIVANLAEKAMTLGPRAKGALQRCSWMRSRTIHLRTPLESAGRYANALADASDDQQQWMPMGGRG